MGKRGPQPTPTRLRVLRGAAPVRRDEPEPPAGEVRAPGWLPGPALEVWDVYAPVAEAMEVLTVADVEAMGRWCDAVARRRQAAQKVEELGAVVYEPITAGGSVVGQRAKKNPWVQVWKDADTQVATIGARFGFTPSERSQLSVGPSLPPLDDLFTNPEAR